MRFRKQLSLMLLALQLPSAFANDKLSLCGDLQQVAQSEWVVQCLVSELVENSFPELRAAWLENRIRFSTFHSSEYFLKTSLLKWSHPRNKILGIYSIDLNPQLFQSDGPNLLALQGILAHELEHLVDYETAGTIDYVKMGVSLFLVPQVYERRTDEKAFYRGYAEGILHYRKWIYSRLSGSALKKKMKRYYTPEQIEEWREAHEGEHRFF